ncbi:MAG: hypothetical protein KBF98_16450 [Rhodoferax sp.]|jgi:hypothetical protein|nr:hypothetical protein [Rhodoferax sp.]MBP9061888.1 hypothetical protein [Rhodoferax sp.]MBP9684085.1 hypothetical protein [Rhodoferax sp.]
MKLKIDTWEARRKVGFSTTVETTVDQVSSWEKPAQNSPSSQQFDVSMDVATRPMELHEFPKDLRMQQAMNVIGRDYKRIQTVIDSLWGHRECGEYLQKLIMSSDDPAGHNRMGFKREVVTAMFVLSDLHDEQFNLS